MKTQIDISTRAAIALLRTAMDRQPDGDRPSPAYVWLTDAVNHLHGYKVQRPAYRASVLYPDAY